MKIHYILLLSISCSLNAMKHSWITFNLKDAAFYHVRSDSILFKQNYFKSLLDTASQKKPIELNLLDTNAYIFLTILTLLDKQYKLEENNNVNNSAAVMDSIKKYIHEREQNLNVVDFFQKVQEFKLKTIAQACEEFILERSDRN